MSAKSVSCVFNFEIILVWLSGCYFPEEHIVYFNILSSSPIVSFNIYRYRTGILQVDRLFPILQNTTIYTLFMKTEKFSCADMDHLKAILVPVPTYLCKNSLILIRVADPDPVGPGRVHIFLLHPDQTQIQFFYFVLLIRVSKKPFRPYRYTILSLIE